MDKPELEPVPGTAVKARVPGAALAALITLIVGLSVSSGSGRAPDREPALASPSVGIASASLSAVDAASSTTPSTSTSPAAPADARPAWVDDLAGQLECDGPRADLGSEVIVPDGPADPVPTTDWALTVLLSPGVYASLPLRGFEPAQVEGHWVLYRYVVDWRLKAIAVATDQFGLGSTFGWEVVGVRACDASEFDPADGLTDGATLWVERDGHRVRADRIFSRVGAAHCGWESAVFLEFEGKQFLRDPKHVLAESTVVTFDATARIPDDAVDSGLHTKRWHLFTIPSGRAVFVRTTDGRIERWPRAREVIGCM